MRKALFLLCTGLLGAVLASFAFGGEAFDPVKVVYTTNGDALYCQMASLEGVHVVCRKANGSVSVPLHNVDFERTFPKYHKEDWETVLLVHAGQLYRDENIIVSDLRMIREKENGAGRSPQVVIFCDVINRSEPSDVRVTVIAKDRQGSSRFAIDLDSETRVGKDQRAVLKKPLDPLDQRSEPHITALRIGDVERRNILNTVDPGNLPMSPEKLREQKIKILKEKFLR